MRLSPLRWIAWLVLAAAFCACEFDGGYRRTPNGNEAWVKGRIDLDNPRKGRPPGESLGRGKCTLENGDTFEGEYFDANGDAVPDAFKPDAGQTGSGGGVSHTTGGGDYYELTCS
jgi:hypothetical protein